MGCELRCALLMLIITGVIRDYASCNGMIYEKNSISGRYKAG